MKQLEYHTTDGRHIIFENRIDENGVVYKLNGEPKTCSTNSSGYRMCTMKAKNTLYNIRVARAMASTFIGHPPNLTYTADHINRNRQDDSLDNIRWVDKSEQVINRDYPKTHKFAFIISRGDDEMTANDWVIHLENQKNHMGRTYTKKMILHYAINKQHGFSYKSYPDLHGEVWKIIEYSKNRKGHWEISNKCRVKYVMSTGVEHVLTSEDVSIRGGYPSIGINRKNCYIHIECFKAFYPEEYTAMKKEDVIMHEQDNKIVFTLDKLRIGTHSENIKDAHDNGKYDGTKTGRIKCVSFINGVFEKEHESQKAAADYLKEKGWVKAKSGRISEVLNNKRQSAYERTWKKQTN
jgi:hypothetical protein